MERSQQKITELVPRSNIYASDSIETPKEVVIIDENESVFKEASDVSNNSISV